MIGSDIWDKLFFALLAVEVLLGFYMKTSKRNIFVKFFIVIYDVLQLFCDFFVYGIFGLLAYKTLGAYETPDGVKLSYEIHDILWLVILTMIFLVFAFLPYGLSKCLYWWCYDGRKISERWIIPSKIISIITAVMYTIGVVGMFLGL